MATEICTVHAPEKYNINYYQYMTVKIEVKGRSVTHTGQKIDQIQNFYDKSGNIKTQ